MVLIFNVRVRRPKYPTNNFVIYQTDRQLNDRFPYRISEAVYGAEAEPDLAELTKYAQLEWQRLKKVVYVADFRGSTAQSSAA